MYPNGTVTSGGSTTGSKGGAIANGRFYFSDTVNNLFQSKDLDVSGQANSGYYILKDNSYPYGFMPDNALSFGSLGYGATASAEVSLKSPESMQVNELVANTLIIKA